MGYKNLRAFKQTSFDFQDGYIKRKYFEYKDDSFDPEIFKKVLKAFLILSLENKKGRFHRKVLNFKPDLQRKIPKSLQENCRTTSGFGKVRMHKNFKKNIK